MEMLRSIGLLVWLKKKKITKVVFASGNFIGSAMVHFN